MLQLTILQSKGSTFAGSKIHLRGRTGPRTAIAGFPCELGLSSAKLRTGLDYTENLSWAGSITHKFLPIDTV